MSDAQRIRIMKSFFIVIAGALLAYYMKDAIPGVVLILGLTAIRPDTIGADHAVQDSAKEV